MFRNTRWLCLAAMLLSSSYLRADSLVIGGSDTSIRFPFGGDSSSSSNFQSGGIYQQIYSASEFSGPIQISQLAFASTSNLSNATLDTFSVDMHLGYAGSSAANPSTSFAANRGSAYTDVFSGTVSFVPEKNNTFDLVFNLSTPYAYDPASGDLLLDVLFNNGPTITGDQLYFAGGSSDTDDRIYSTAGGATGHADFNTLQTEFTYTSSTPEPATFGLLGVGAAAFFVAWKRKRA